MTVQFLDGSQWNPSSPFFKRLIGRYAKLCPNDAGMNHQLEMIAAVGGVILAERSRAFVRAFLAAMERVASERIDDLAFWMKEYPHDLYERELEAYQRLRERMRVQAALR
jgi:hypothetical protein